MKSRTTELRQEILQIIEAINVPLSVKEIHNSLDQKADISTIYRALQSFQKQEKVLSLSFYGNTQYYYSSTNSHCHFIICNKCHRIDSFDQCLAHKIESNVKENLDYAITSHVFYFQGVCRPCREKSLLE